MWRKSGSGFCLSVSTTPHLLTVLLHSDSHCAANAAAHLPEVVGSARGYELTGNATQHAIASHFFNILTAGENETWDPSRPGGHSFATGGSNAAEHWFSADNLADSLQPYRWGNYRDIGARTEESCTQYNTLKVSRHLFTWSADARQADFYERGLLNGILGNMNAVNGTPAACT